MGAREKWLTKRCNKNVNNLDKYRRDLEDAESNYDLNKAAELQSW